MASQAELDALRAKYKIMKSQGLEESTSKSMGKVSLQISQMKDALKRMGIDTSGGGTVGGLTSQNALSDKFTNEGNAFIDRYKTAIPTIYNRLSQEQGLPALQKTAQNTTQMLEDIPSQVNTAGKQFGMSSSRMGQRITGQTSQIAPIAQKAIGQAQFAQDTVNTLFQNEMAPYGVEASMLASRQAMEQTGYTNAVANQLSITLQNMANGQALSLAEMNNAANMAQLEKQYKMTLANNLTYYNATNKGGGSNESWS